MEQTTAPTTQKSRISEIVNKLEQTVQQLQEKGSLQLPADYSAGNALRAAALILSELKTKDDKPVTEACTGASINNALLRMLTFGLNPMRNQCYFIPYGNELVLMVSYFGKLAMARRAGLEFINPNVVYEGDDFEYTVNPDTGQKILVRHKQALKNISDDKMLGAYAIYRVSGITNMEVMTVKEIKQAWLQGAAYGRQGKTSTHDKFGHEMAVKTVMNRALKRVINASSDAMQLGWIDDEEDMVEQPESKLETIELEEPKTEQQPVAETKQQESKPEKEVQNADNQQVQLSF
jgi:recombination protein RecT